MGSVASSSQIDRADIELLKTKTCFDEKTIKLYYKGFLKDVPDGRLNCERFSEIYKEHFPPETAGRICSDIFAAYDANKDGFIDFREFMLAVNMTCQVPLEDKWRLVFKMFDINGSGFLTKEDLARAFDAINSSNCGNIKINSWEKAGSIFAKSGSLGESDFVGRCLAEQDLCQAMATF